MPMGVGRIGNKAIHGSDGLVNFYFFCAEVCLTLMLFFFCHLSPRVLELFVVALAAFAALGPFGAFLFMVASFFFVLRALDGWALRGLLFDKVLGVSDF
jgi:hypothetical protein